MDQAHDARYNELKQKRDSGSITEDEVKEIENLEKTRSEGSEKQKQG